MLPGQAGNRRTLAILDYDMAADALRETLRHALADLAKLSAKELIDHRYEKFRRMGNFFAEGAHA